MTLKELTIDSLLALDGGRVATAFQHVLRRILDTTAQTFTISPLPGELEKASLDMQRRIGADLNERLPEAMTVLFGRP